MANKNKSKNSLGDPSGKTKIEQFGHQAVKPVGVIGGFLLASGAGYLIDKIPFLKPNPEAGSKAVAVIKSLVKPVVITSTGIAGMYLTRKDEKAGEEGVPGMLKGLARHASYGFTGGGLYSGVKVFLKKDLTTGLGQPEGSANQVKMLQETKKEIEDLIASNTYRLNLPEAKNESSEVGYLSPTLELEDTETVL